MRRDAPGGVPRPGARRHGRRLRERERARAGRAARRRDVPLDRAPGAPSSSPPTARRRCRRHRVRDRAARASSSRYRMAGYDLEVDGPHFVPLEVGLLVCVRAGLLPRARAGGRARRPLERRARADGTLGFFHPDRFTFGEPVYLSAIVAAAQDVQGVQSVTPLVFQRQRDDASSALDTGVLDDGPARDRAARRRPELPRARRARADDGRRQMSADCACGCCAGVAQRTPLEVQNRPGLLGDRLPRRRPLGLPRLA